MDPLPARLPILRSRTQHGLSKLRCLWKPYAISTRHTAKDECCYTIYAAEEALVPQPSGAFGAKHWRSLGERHVVGKWMRDYRSGFRVRLGNQRQGFYLGKVFRPKKLQEGARDIVGELWAAWAYAAHTATYPNNP